MTSDMWIDKNGWAHVENQYDPSTFAENNPGSVDWEATKRYRKKEERYASAAKICEVEG